MDVSRAVARFLELLKLGGADPAARRGRRADRRRARRPSTTCSRRRISPEQQREALEAIGARRLPARRARASARRRSELVAARDEPSLEAFLPRRGRGPGLSATDIELYRTCPLKYKFARVFGIPQEQTINQRFGIVIHQVLERFHSQGATGGEARRAASNRLMALFAAAWRRSGFGESDDELQFRERAVEALRRYHARESPRAARARTGSSASSTSRSGPHHLRGRVDRVDELPRGRLRADRLQDRRLRSPSRELETDVQLAIYRLAAREAWQPRRRRGQLLVRARRREGRRRRARPTTSNASRAP